MTFKFGFELEGFYREGKTITLPPKTFPTDDFPGLVEVRTIGGEDIDVAYFSLLNQVRQYNFDFSTTEHTFSGEEKRKIRSRHYEKGGIEINNIYGKEPRQLGNKTLASFQINISRVDRYGADGQRVYGLFDFVPIIRRLDNEFKDEIKASNRQPGFYAVKDGCRVEYRSLPNSVFEVNLDRSSILMRRITTAVYG